MNKQAINHQPKSKDAYAFNENTIHLRLKTGKNDFESIKIVAFDPYYWLPTQESGKWEFNPDALVEYTMEKEHQSKYFDHWFGSIGVIDTLRIRYGFLLKSKNETYFYGSYNFYEYEKYEEVKLDALEHFNFPFINQEDIYTAPAWVNDTIWYQIFTERFNNGDPSINKENTLDWNSVNEINNNMYFGGDLRGVINKLEYIKDLGINGIYFTPLFESPSTHKYDTSDYYKIDSSFGNKEVLKELVEKAHSMGIKVMLDAVFNHCGFEHEFWQDVIKNGNKSKYYDCFYITGEPIINYDINKYLYETPTAEVMKNLNYRTFAFALMMPKWNTAHPLVREHLLEVGRYWIEECNIDGWRLDVSNEVSHDFWRAFRKEVKKLNKEIYIVGENWDNSYPWLTGDQFDAVMNYELLNVIWKFIGSKPNIKAKSNTSTFIEELGNYFVAYPKSVINHMFNMMDSHDTLRVMDIADNNINKAKLVYLLQMIMPGSPSVYYGSEWGYTGKFEANRKCMVFNEELYNMPLYIEIKQLIKLRKKYEAFRNDNFNWTILDENRLKLIKKSESEILNIIVNNCDEEFIYEGLIIKPFGYSLLIKDIGNNILYKK